MPFADPEKRRLYQKRYQREYYLRNRDEVIKRTSDNRRNLRERKKDWVLSKLGGCCKECGYDGAALAVHHTDPTYKRPWGDVRGGTQGGIGATYHRTITDYSWADLKAKIHTLELLCFNCHGEHHMTHGYTSLAPLSSEEE